MFIFMLGDLKYSYLVGTSTIGIITPTKQKYFRSIAEIIGNRELDTGIYNGTSDSRVTAGEVAAYVLKHKMA